MRVVESRSIDVDGMSWASEVESLSGCVLCGVLCYFESAEESESDGDEVDESCPNADGIKHALELAARPKQKTRAHQSDDIPERIQ